MVVLGIESSCDETGVAVYHPSLGLLGHRLYSQVTLHQAYGGVVPELASRDHLKRLLFLIDGLLNDCRLSLEDIDAVAYTEGPGLGGALLVGSGMAHALAYALDKMVIPIHHLEAHLLSPMIGEPNLSFPFVALLVSGGHTQLIAVKSLGQYHLLGETLDDAAGEAFDKGAKLLGLDYPGGPILAKLAEQGHSDAHVFPRPMLHHSTLDMSFSGLKTAMLTATKTLGEPPKGQILYDLAASYQAAIIDVLVQKAKGALVLTGYTELVVAGGVGANQRLREQLKALSLSGYQVHYPEPWLCTDNGAMIAHAGVLHANLGKKAGGFSVKTRWPL